ncbi:tripartite tricarboxylate transporter TctB family protein [Clostridium sp. MCC353]|uniref:tripartite tricarboxylate transporter TctB family protein n=1 Tax=Clostridium sp. MCC353 TaxID=2592646 RepID=UPI001C03962F|nr:tripartite tricarboxylate transporter TctB family protein [Clostridium sp. MCC353]
MEIKIKTNLVSGILFLILSGVLLAVIPAQIRQTYQQNQYIDAKAIPQMVGCITALISVILIVKSLVLHQETIKVYAVKPEMMAVLYFCGLLFYLFLIPRLGFFLSSLLMGVGTMAYQKVKSVKQWLVVLAIMVVIYFGFSKGLNIMLPEFAL